MKTTFLVRGSSDVPHQVEFSSEGADLRVFCHCQAGVLQQMCKHKLALIKGDTNLLFDQAQRAALSELRASSQFKTLMQKTEDYEKQLAEIESAKNDLTKKEKKLKASFARGLLFGFDP